MRNTFKLFPNKTLDVRTRLKSSNGSLRLLRSRSGLRLFIGKPNGPLLQVNVRRIRTDGGTVCVLAHERQKKRGIREVIVLISRCNR
jgi:hypothetical protein